MISPSFDVVSLAFALTMLLYAMGLAFLVLAQLNIGGKLNRDIGFGVGLVAVGGTLLTFRAPDIQYLTLPTGNVIASIGAYLALRAVRRYIGVPFSRFADLLVGAVCCLYFLGNLLLGNPDLLRVLYISVFFAGAGLATMWPVIARTVTLRPAVARLVVFTCGCYPLVYGAIAGLCLAAWLWPGILGLTVQDVILLAFMVTPPVFVVIMLGYLGIVIESLFHESRGFRQRAETIVHRSPVAAILTEADTNRIVDLNRAFLQIFDLPSDPVVGRKIDDLGLVPRRWLAAYRRRLQATGRVEGLKVRKPGDVGSDKQTFMVWGYRIHLNSVPHDLSFISNISNEAKAAAVLRSERETARNEVQVKSRFLAMMSHDFRTPLSAAAGMADLLRAAERDPQKQHRLDTIISSMATLSRMVDDILDMSRLNSGSFRITEKPFDPVLLAERIEAVCGPSAALKNLALTVEMDSDLPESIQGDQHRLAQIALNLLSNAIKFTEYGRVVFTLGQDRDADGSPTFVMTVRDTGIGIDADMMDTLFEPFRQGRGAREKGGVGLGLSICREIAQAMGGTVSASREPGGGSLFRFSMRLKLPDPSREDADQDAVGTFWSGVRVLLAEDTAINREVMAEQLRLAGASVVSVSNGAPVPILALSASPPFDIVLLDIQMSGMSGIEAASRLRSKTRGKSLLTAALTAYSGSADREKCLEAGIDLFFSKPPDLDRMAQAILAHRELSGAAGSQDEGVGFDVVAAAKGWGNDAEPVAAMMGRFAGAYANFDGRLSGLFDARQGMELFTTVHQLRGLAGLLHAGALKHAADKAEKALNDPNRTDLEIRALLVALEKTVLQYAKLLEEGRPAGRTD